MKGEEGMTSLGIVIVLIFVLSIIALISHFIPSLQFAVNISDQWWTRVQTITQILIVLIAFVALIYSFAANQRSEKLFVGADVPLIDVTPIGIGQAQGVKGVYFSTTFLTIANYSGFKAYNIGIDLRYGDRPWILEWMKADAERQKKQPGQKIIDKEVYMSAPPILLKDLPPGKTKAEEIDFASPSSVTGQLNLETDVCSKGPNGLPVWVRVSWQNKSGHVFDEVHKYSLICQAAQTAPVSNHVGYSFTFIPEGIMSKKDTKFLTSKDKTN